jgi:conjugal transfer pilus assembly protein TraB
MAATLLSGLDAPTSNDARGTPVPVILRIKAPAMLPNEVKADLQGCFVIADGRGNLATERAELVLVSLSCLDTRGQAVIDQKVKGFVVDDDGKIGLRGKVVAKMGSAIARSMLAGFFGGAGDALKSAATTTSINPLGTTQTIEARDVALAGVGTGLAGGFKELQKFYLDLARQSMPVVEVGATRPVTLVISEGTTLTIRKIAKGVSR